MKFRFFKNAKKICRDLPVDLSFTLEISNQQGDFVKFLWDSQNIWTLLGNIFFVIFDLYILSNEWKLCSIWQLFGGNNEHWNKKAWERVVFCFAPVKKWHNEDKKIKVTIGFFLATSSTSRKIYFNFSLWIIGNCEMNNLFVFISCNIIYKLKYLKRFWIGKVIVLVLNFESFFNFLWLACLSRLSQ